MRPVQITSLLTSTCQSGQKDRRVEESRNLTEHLSDGYWLSKEQGLAAPCICQCTCCNRWQWGQKRKYSAKQCHSVKVNPLKIKGHIDQEMIQPDIKYERHSNVHGLTRKHSNFKQECYVLVKGLKKCAIRAAQCCSIDKERNMQLNRRHH